MVHCLGNSLIKALIRSKNLSSLWKLTENRPRLNISKMLTCPQKMNIVKDFRRQFSHKHICCLQTMLLSPSAQYHLGADPHCLQTQRFPPTSHHFIFVVDKSITWIVNTNRYQIAGKGRRDGVQCQKLNIWTFNQKPATCKLKYRLAVFITPGQNRSNTSWTSN